MPNYNFLIHVEIAVMCNYIQTRRKRKQEKKHHGSINKIHNYDIFFKLFDYRY